MKKHIILFLGLSIFGLAKAWAQSPADIQSRVNKLQYMYHFFYFPFSIDFREGKSVSEILPFIRTSDSEPPRLVKPNELQELDKEWNALKAPWKQRSLLLSTTVGIGETVAITQKLISHRIALSRGAFDTMNISERIQLNEVLKNKPPEVQATFKQMRFLRSFLSPQHEDRFNFFIFSPSWCESSREYRVLFETYLKTFPASGFVLHSVVVEDPKEEIFDSRLMRELFPHPMKYTHDSVPRFLAIETIQGNTLVWEEGEALKELYDRFFVSNRGYLNSKNPLKKISSHRDTASFNMTPPSNGKEAASSPTPMTAPNSSLTPTWEAPTPRP